MWIFGVGLKETQVGCNSFWFVVVCMPKMFGVLLLVFLPCFLIDARAVLGLADLSSQSAYVSIPGCTRHDQEALLFQDKIARCF